MISESIFLPYPSAKTLHSLPKHFIRYPTQQPPKNNCRPTASDSRMAVKIQFADFRPTASDWRMAVKIQFNDAEIVAYDCSLDCHFFCFASARHREMGVSPIGLPPTMLRW